MGRGRIGIAPGLLGLDRLKLLHCTDYVVQSRLNIRPYLVDIGCLHTGKESIHDSGQGRAGQQLAFVIASEFHDLFDIKFHGGSTRQMREEAEWDAISTYAGEKPRCLHHTASMGDELSNWTKIRPL